VFGGRYGLGSKDLTPTMIKAVFDNLRMKNPKNHYTVGITDDITFTSLKLGQPLDVSPDNVVRCKFWGLGGDGTVGANKDAIKIIGDHTDMYVQGYFAYDSKKSGGVTISHLRFGKNPIKSTYLIDRADYIACHNPSYVDKYDLIEGIREGGTFVLNAPWSLEDIEKRLPNTLKQHIGEKNLKFYIIDAVRIAEEVGLGGRINMIMQAAFFKLANVIPVENAISYLKTAIKKTYEKKGKDIVEMNQKAVDMALDEIIKVEYPKSWAHVHSDKEKIATESDFVTNIMRPILAQKGDKLPVSVFTPAGIFPTGTTKYEKRGVAINVPEWFIDNCIQCNQCAMVCPHAAIRPFILTENELKKAPAGFEAKKLSGKKEDNLYFKIQVYPDDCVGCGNCADICPSKTKALVMKPLSTQRNKQIPFQQYVDTLPIRTGGFEIFSVKGSQFQQPLLEFSGACAGCGETPYLKLVTQLFGDRMIIANATGCSSIWGGSAPSVPFTVNKNGHGPAWANSLFEDNAEYGFGMVLATFQRREHLAGLIREAQTNPTYPETMRALFQDWLNNRNNAEQSKYYGNKIKQQLEIIKHDELLQRIWNFRTLLTKKSIWAVGGDGWAYDIGYGGLDHVIAMGEDINILVFDTEVYSNTGGQSSKATPIGSVAKFASSGKKTKKKDLGFMATTYGYVYVASVAMGANKNQLIKALKEAESYPGPSLIIAYAPCITHGIKAGMGKSQHEEKRAVDSGYWPLYRYDPRLAQEGKNPFQLDSKEPDGTIQEFINGEIRYNTLTRYYPKEATLLHQQLQKEIKNRYKKYKSISEQ
jgi:pyruvate-ferredoxin/flavodoxin oxidoreductase